MTDNDVRRVVRDLQPEDHELESPPASVWGGIAEELGLGAANPEGPDATAFTPRAVTTEPTAELVDAPPTSPDEPDRDAPPATTNAPPSAWRRPALALAAAACLVLVAVVVGGSLVRQLTAPSESLVAQAELAPLDDRATGTDASVIAIGEERELRLAEDLAGDLVATDGHYEVWLLDEEVQTLVSLGPLRPDGRYAIPAAVSLSELPVVDVSAEPADGNPDHSGDSVLRGVLDVEA